MRNGKKIIAFVLMIVFMLTPVYGAADGKDNVVEGNEYTLSAGVPIDGSYANHPENETDTKFKLTDGKTASATSSGANWCKWLRGVSRIVDFDLGELYAVNGFEASFLQNIGSGIYVPRYVDVYFSDDGEDYFLWASPEMPFGMHDTAKKVGVYTVNDTAGFTARYVKVVICVDINVWCDEIKLYGTKTTTAKKVTGEKYTVEQKGYFPKYDEKIAGIGDVIKIYNGRYAESGKDNTAMGDNTVEELIPYVAYVGEDGEIKDTLFDSVTFVPIHSDYPSGGRLTLTANKPGAVMSDWMLYFENTFREGINVDALNTAVGQVYDKLGIDKKMTVLLTLPYPTVLTGSFGDIDGDGVSERCVTLAERTAIIRWFTDLYIERFNEGNYENLSLGGFYWYREEVNESTTNHERELVCETSDYIHSLGYTFVFDPFYLACGFDEFEALGFDCAFLQPNFCFRDYFTDEALSEFALVSKRYGTGGEIEVTEPYNLLNDPKGKGTNFEKYLAYGAKYGFSDSAHSYYQGAGPGSFYTMCKSSNTYLRSLYDKLYAFVKGTYTYDAPSVSEETFTGEAGSSVRGGLEVSGGSDDISVAISAEPSHGRVHIVGTKSFVYVPDEGFVGTDTFRVRASDAIASGDETVITVVVNSSTSVDGTSSEAAPAESEPETVKPGPIGYIIAAVAVLAAAAVAAVVIVKKKKAK